MIRPPPTSTLFPYTTLCRSFQTRTWTATDGCGNAATAVSRTVSWTEDKQAPVITATGTTLALHSYPIPSLIQAALGAATGTDNCGDVTPSSTDSTLSNSVCS